jgi:hypothetical protein
MFVVGQSYGAFEHAAHPAGDISCPSLGLRICALESDISVVHNGETWPISKAYALNNKETDLYLEVAFSTKALTTPDPDLAEATRVAE